MADGGRLGPVFFLDAKGFADFLIDDFLPGLVWAFDADPEGVMGLAGEDAVDGTGVATVERSAVEDPTAGRLIRKADGPAALGLSLGRGKREDELASWASMGGAARLPFLLCVGVGVEGWCMFVRESLSFIGGRPCGGEFTMRAGGRGGWRFGDGWSLDGIISARDSRGLLSIYYASSLLVGI